MTIEEIRLLLKDLDRQEKILSWEFNDLYTFVNQQQSQIDQLQKENESLKGKLLKSYGLKIICKGAGKCDHDGSTCNENDNCGSYEPITIKREE